MAPSKFSNKGHAKAKFEEQETVADHAVITDIDDELREIYFLIMHFLSAGPCQRTFGQFWNEIAEHQLLARRYQAWYSRSGASSGGENDDGVSFPLSYNKLVERYLHIGKDHLVKLLKQLILNVVPSLDSMGGRSAPSAVDVSTLLGTGSSSLLADRNEVNKQVKPLPAYLRWPHMQADQMRGLSLREIGGGFPKHHRAPSIHFACYTIAKPLTMVQKMQNIKKLRGHRDAVYCAIFDRSGRYVVTGSDDRLVKIWSMETAFCLASCRGHEGVITDLAVSSNNALVASASNDYGIRVWCLPNGLPISVLRGHIGAVTAIAFSPSPRPNSVYHLLSSISDAHQLFAETSDCDDVVSATTTISRFVRHNRHKESVSLFSRMLVLNIRPNEFAFGTIINSSTALQCLNSAASIAALGMGRSFHACAIKFLGNFDVFVGNSLVSFYAKCGSMEDSLLNFDKLPERSIVSWNALISGYAQNGRGKEALDLFQKMQCTGLQPNSVTLLGVPLACNYAGLVNEGYSYFNQARLKHPSMLKPEHYACMVDLLSRSGHFHKAERFICDLPFDPGIGFWKALLGGCQIHSNMELGEVAAKKIQALDPGDVSSYVMLSNAHSAAGRWQNVSMIRQEMREKEMKRVPGCSWIEIKNGIHVFVNADRRHSKRDGIYMVLRFFLEHVAERQASKILTES